MRKHTFLCVISFMMACHKAAPPQVQAASQPASTPAANKAPPLGPIPGGIDPMRDIREDAAQMRGHKLILGTVLASFQPKTLADFRCDVPENTQGGVQGMVITQSAMGCRQGVGKDERSLIITIADYNAHPRMLSTQEAMVKQKASKWQKPVKLGANREVNAHAGFIEIDQKTKIGRGSVMLKRRFLVSVQLQNASLAELEKVLGAVDLDGIEKLTSTAENQITLDGNGNSVVPKTSEPKKDKP